MYKLSDFGEMMLDSVRTSAYVDALRQTIRPDSVVLDIGTGTGIFAVLARQFGARRVFALEPNDVINVAREVAAANGCAEVIEFYQARSTDIDLSELADVIISDLRGVLPLFGQHIPAIIDARRRLLAPGGVLISQRDDMWLSVIEAPNEYRPVTAPWRDNLYDLDMRVGGLLMANQWFRIAAEAKQLLAAPAHWGALDYNTINSPDFAAKVNLVAARDGLAHGLCTWFDATLAEGVSFSNAPGFPGTPKPIYRNAFFPFIEPVELRTGDTITVKLMADLVGDDYIWRWDTLVLERGSAELVKADYRQSALAGEPMSLVQLRKRAADHVPQLNDDGAIDQAILQLMHSGLSVGAIARRIAAEHGQRFGNWQQAMARVGELSLRYSR